MSTIVIIGGGYAALSCAEALRQGDDHCTIRIFTMERFCSRPELFFRFKFLGNAEQGKGFGSWKDMEKFVSKNRVEWNEECRVVRVDREQKCITVERMKVKMMVVEEEGETEETVHYDRLVFATGGFPNIVQYPIVERAADGDSSWDMEELACAIPPSPLVQRIMAQNECQQVRNMLFVRNIEEVEALHAMMENIYWHNREHGSTLAMREKDDIHDITVIGAGALAVDIVTSILDGYAAVSKQQQRKQQEPQEPQDNANPEPHVFQETEYLPRILVLSRQASLSNIGFSLLQDKDACDLIVARALDPSLDYHRFVSFIGGATVSSVICTPCCKEGDNSTVDNSHSRRVIHGIRYRSASTTDLEENIIEIRSRVVVQAIGVKPNTSLAKDAGLKVGEGIMVNERFEVIVNDDDMISDPSIYAIGDCAEVSVRYGSIGGYTKSNTESIVWKNWTSAREMGIECARQILDQREGSCTLWFNQTLRMFGLYVACLGRYEIPSHTDANSDTEFTVVKRNWTRNDWYMLKLVFRNSTPDCVSLVGVLLLGPDMKHYRLGTRLLELLRLERELPREMGEKMLADDFDISALLKTLQSSDSSIDTEQLRAMLSSGKFTASKSITTSKKVFKNPLAGKKKVKSTASQSGKKKFKNPLLLKKSTTTQSKESTVSDTINEELSNLTQEKLKFNEENGK